MPTQGDFANQMVAQLRVLDPSISAEIGTPERKIIDTVAQALAENQIDLTILTGSLDIDSKFGSDLDKFLGIFGFARQRGTAARGWVTFSRVSAATIDVTIPAGTQLQAPNPDDRGNIIFVTKSAVTLQAGSLTVDAPVEAANTGSAGSVSANSITEFVVSPVLGITSVTNSLPTTNGLDAETDDALKVRFKNTVFRNVSGTVDQYLALAVATQYTTKANVVGPISRYREYVQVPDVDDASNDPDSSIAGGGNAGEWTTTPSTIPYSQHIYSTIPYFVSNGQVGVEAVFYRQNTDYVLNAPYLNVGDARRNVTNLIANGDFQTNTTGWGPFISGTVSWSTATDAVSGQGVLKFQPPSGTACNIKSDFTPSPSTTYSAAIWFKPQSEGDYLWNVTDAAIHWSSASFQSHLYANTWVRLEFPNFTASSNTSGLLMFNVNKVSGVFDGETVYLDAAICVTGTTVPAAYYPNAPNLTFLNVYQGTDSDVTAVRPKDIMLFEHSYLSSASRNDPSHNVYNAVDVYVDGNNPTTADTVIPRPTGSVNLFSGTLTNRYYYDNFRRVGEPSHRPVIGNVFTPLFWQPVMDLPDTITIDDLTYRKGYHYWAVEDVSALRNTVRSRNGIEWAVGVLGQANGDPDTGPFTGPDKITTSGGGKATSIAVESYVYDKNIIDLQAALEGSKQVTTDILAHRATTHYFKLDITVMYSPGATASDVNTNVQTAVQAYFANQYFGAVIQLSDLLQVIHNVGGVDNVRWSHDLLSSRHCVTECNDLGVPSLGLVVDQVVAGGASITEVQQLYLVGSPVGGTFKLSYTPPNSTSVSTTGTIAYTASAATVLSALTGASIPVTTVTGSGVASSPFVVTFSATGARGVLTPDASGLSGTKTVFDTDFFLRDNELPALPSTALSTDTIAGLIIRPRAQGTWNQL